MQIRAKIAKADPQFGAFMGALTQRTAWIWVLLGISHFDFNIDFRPFDSKDVYQRPQAYADFARKGSGRNVKRVERHRNVVLNLPLERVDCVFGQVHGQALIFRPSLERNCGCTVANCGQSVFWLRHPKNTIAATTSTMTKRTSRATADLRLAGC
jgi:hypothetical protein